jgi:cysteinyl-tRNA synthetase
MKLLDYIISDFQAALKNDPAARNKLEVALSYPGLHAIVLHRINHLLWGLGTPILPRVISNLINMFTGIDIHPAAQIGKGFFIDHGNGVVIGETTMIGDHVVLYQNVTLGGTGKETGKRHPTLGNHVVVGAGAKVLGAITIGDYVKIGANSVVLKSAPAHSIVVGVPGKVIKQKSWTLLHHSGAVETLDHVHLPDPVNSRFEAMENKIIELEKKIAKLEGKQSAMKIYNSLTGKKEDFIPMTPGAVKMYVCGITAYDVCHLGHARSSIVFDVIVRYLRYKGFKVAYLKNFTDIDDKIIAKAQAEQKDCKEIAETYICHYCEDMEKIGVMRADIEPKATEHIDEMIQAVDALIQKGVAYQTNGDVFYDISTFEGYGKLSKRGKEGMIAGARVEVDTRKKNPGDFALWKSSKQGEPGWDSPFGFGRPGWHLECSVMSMKYLGESFDIHGGGADLIFPHHENEIAQSEALTGKPFVKYWMHNGFITINQEKMSKSLGNFFAIKEIVMKYDPEAIRYFILTTHYRSPIEFSEEQLKDCETTLDRYYTTAARIENFLKQKNFKTSSTATPAEEAFQQAVGEFQKKFIDAMDDDFNTALALGHVFELIREINRFLDSKPNRKEAATLINQAYLLLTETNRILNLFSRTPSQWYSDIMSVKRIPLSVEDIQAKILKRANARAQKNWQEADRIRQQLAELGILLEDRPEGAEWKVNINMDFDNARLPSDKS